MLLLAGGFKRQIEGFNAERIGNTARSLAVGRHAFSLAREHAKNRRQFGRPLCEFQGIQCSPPMKLASRPNVNPSSPALPAE